MSDQEVNSQEQIDLIKQLYEQECPSISGRSSLTFAIGRHDVEDTWHLRIADNTGRGMWFDGWASAAAIEKIAIGSSRLTARSFHSLHPGRSINTGGFVLAALKALGMVRVQDDNGRIHEHVPGVTFEQVAKAAIEGLGAGRKAKGRHRG